MNWEYAGSTYNDSFILNGIDIFKKNWIDTGKMARVKDPRYGVMKTFTVWKISNGINEIRFAAGEFSNGIWGIYTAIK